MEGEEFRNDQMVGHGIREDGGRRSQRLQTDSNYEGWVLHDLMSKETRNGHGKPRGRLCWARRTWSLGS